MVRSTLLCLCVRVALRAKIWFQRSFIHRSLKVKFGSITPLQNTNDCILGMFLLMIDGLKSKFAQEIFANFVISLLSVPKFDKKQNVPKSFKINSRVFQNMFWTVFSYKWCAALSSVFVSGWPFGEKWVSTVIYSSMSQGKIRHDNTTPKHK